MVSVTEGSRIGFWASCFGAEHEQNRMAVTKDSLSNDMENTVDLLLG